jgi:hypothetical protein
MLIKQPKGDVNNTTIPWLGQQTQGFLLGMVSAVTYEHQLKQII